MNAQTAIRAPFAPPFGAVTPASLNFLKPMAGRLVSYQYDPPPGVPQRNGEDEPHLVAVRDARPLAAELSLDEQGFELLQAPTAFAAFDDDAAISTAYYAEVERLLAAATGAQRVIAFDHNVRNARRAAGGEAGIRGPVPRTHNDFTAKSGPERAAAELAARGIDPLALADARTIAPADWVETDLVYRDRVGETYALGFSPGQAWYYFPLLAPDEAILIKGFDSSEEVARFTPHSAFADPASPADAPERESIEVRALVIY